MRSGVSGVCRIFLLSSLSLLLSCGPNYARELKQPDQPPLPSASIVVSAPERVSNPMLREWVGPLGGVPPFSGVMAAHLAPALEAAISNARAEVDRIANQSAPPTFDNTLAELERALRPYHRVMAVYGVWTSSMKTPEVQKIETEMAPKIASFLSTMAQNEALFSRISTIHESADAMGLTPEQKRLAWYRYDQFVREGARLDAPTKARLVDINEKLTALFTRFSQNVVNDESRESVVISNVDDLAGLPESYISSAQAEATSRGQSGKWIVSNTRSSVQPFLTFSDRREMREKVWRMFVSRGDGGGETDNNEIIVEILSLRTERAKLLGYASHANYRLENAMAKTPDQAMALMLRVWKPAVAAVRKQVKDMQAIADKELGKGKLRIEPWDYRYYAEKLRRQKYDLDDNEVKPYLQLDKLRDGMFWVAGELHGLKFERESSDSAAVGIHEDVSVWRVKDASSGGDVGLFYFDPWARQGKQSGAWAVAYRLQERFDGQVYPIISNNSNFVKGASGTPTLLSWDDAETLFHEFGHALHGFLSNVQYPSLAGTMVYRDYVEFPSQMNERWLATPEVLQKYAINPANNQPIPLELVKRIEKTSTFNQGFDTVEFLASAILDMRLHIVDAQTNPVDPRTFETQTLASIGMPKEIVMRHRLPHFLHIFSSDSYSAAYYSYLWADVLASDGYQAFVEAGGPYDKSVAARLREHVLSKGNTVDPAVGYRLFRGRDARFEALMKKRGL